MGKTDPIWRRAAVHTLHTALVLKAALEEILRESTDLMLADNEALINLRDGPLRMSVIADQLVLSRGGTTKVIDRLEAAGYVARSTDPDDRRAIRVEITDAGTQAAASARKLIDRELKLRWDGIVTSEESALVVDIMERVLDATEAHT